MVERTVDLVVEFADLGFRRYNQRKYFNGLMKFHYQQCLLFPDQFQPLSQKAFGLPLVLQHRPRVFCLAGKGLDQIE